MRGLCGPAPQTFYKYLILLIILWGSAGGTITVHDISLPFPHVGHIGNFRACCRGGRLIIFEAFHNNNT